MPQLIYEFDSVTDRNGKSKMNKYEHTNPVFIHFLTIGKGAKLVYIDKPTHGIMTSPVEEIMVFENSISIITANTEYWLKPYIREDNK